MKNPNNLIMPNKKHWTVDVLGTIAGKITRQPISHYHFNEKGIDIDDVLTGPYEKGTNREFYCLKINMKPNLC